MHVFRCYTFYNSAIFYLNARFMFATAAVENADVADDTCCVRLVEWAMVMYREVFRGQNTPRYEELPTQ